MVSLVLLAAAVILFWPIVTTVVFAATIAAVMVPIIAKVERRISPGGMRSWQRSLTAALATLLTLLVLAAFVAVIFVIVVYNFDMLRDFAVKVAAFLQDAAGDVLGRRVDLKESATQRLDQLLEYVESAFATLANILMHIIIFSSSLYLFNRHGTTVVEAAHRLIPDEYSEMTGRFKRAAYSSLYAIYVVHLGTALITFVLALPFFHLIGYGEHAMFWSLLAGIFQLIPIIGPSLIMFAISAYAFATGDGTTGVLVLAVGYPVVSAFPDIVFRPLMMGREMKLNPLILILGFFGGIMSMGLIGFALGPMVLKLLIESFSMTSEIIMKKNGKESG